MIIEKWNFFFFSNPFIVFQPASSSQPSDRAWFNKRNNGFSLSDFYNTDMYSINPLIWFKVIVIHQQKNFNRITPTSFGNSFLSSKLVSRARLVLIKDEKNQNYWIIQTKLVLFQSRKDDLQVMQPRRGNISTILT